MVKLTRNLLWGLGASLEVTEIVGNVFPDGAEPTYDALAQLAVRRVPLRQIAALFGRDICDAFNQAVQKRLGKLCEEAVALSGPIEGVLSTARKAAATSTPDDAERCAEELNRAVSTVVLRARLVQNHYRLLQAAALAEAFQTVPWPPREE